MFSFSTAHAAYLDPDRHLAEGARDNELLKDAFQSGHASLHDLNLWVVESTGGAGMLGAQVTWIEDGAIEEPTFEWKGGELVETGTCLVAHSAEKTLFLYGAALRELGTWADLDAAGKLVLALVVARSLADQADVVPFATVDCAPDNYADGRQLHDTFTVAMNQRITVAG